MKFPFKSLHRFLQRNFLTYNFLINVLHIFYKRKIHPCVAIINKGSITFEKYVTIQRASRIDAQEDGKIVIGEGCWLADHVVLETKSVLSIGMDTSLQTGCHLIGSITIGKNCLFAPNVFISSGQHNYDIVPQLLIRDQDELSKVLPKTVIIDDDCWLGINSVIMSGVHIGKGCIIGANSVVTQDLLPYSVVGGAPARFIKNRLNFAPPEEIHADKLENLPYFYSGFANSYRKWKDNLNNFDGIEITGDFTVCLDSKNRKFIELTLLHVNKAVTANGVISIFFSQDEKTILNCNKVQRLKWPVDKNTSYFNFVLQNNSDKLLFLLEARLF